MQNHPLNPSKILCKYTVLHIDHQINRRNSLGLKEEYQQFAKVCHQTDDSKEAKLKHNEKIDSLMKQLKADNPTKIFSQIRINDSIIEIRDETPGWILKSYKLLFTCMILEYDQLCLK